MAAFPHVCSRSLAACAVGGACGRGIAGLLKATTGANEVISTIMLNWTAVYVGVYLFGLGGPLQNDDPQQRPSPSPTTSSRARGCRSSGATRSCRACTSGIFIALAVTVALLGAARTAP